MGNFVLDDVHNEFYMVRRGKYSMNGKLFRKLNTMCNAWNDRGEKCCVKQFGFC